MSHIPIRQITELEASESFKIRDIKTLLSEKDMEQDLHRHDFFFILALEKGLGEHVIDFTSYLIDDYSVFFMKPGQVHQLTLRQGSTGYLMEFNADFYRPFELPAKQVLQKVSNKTHCQLDAARFNKILSVLAYIFEEYTERRDRYTEIIKAYMSIFFTELYRQSKSPISPSKLKNSYYQDRLEDFLQLLESHITTCKQVSQYADMLHLSMYQLNAITKETVGKNCSQLINEHIILEAKRHLLATSNQIAEIAYDLGYEDTSYFIRFFKKQTGYTPEIFRLNFK